MSQPYNVLLDPSSAAYKEWEEAHRMLNRLGAPVMHEGPPQRAATLWERIQWGMKAAADLKTKIVAANVQGQPDSDLTIEFADALPEAEESSTKEFTLTEDQDNAWKKIQAWATLPAYKAQYFVLRGYAGTGKTYLLQLLSRLELKNTVYFTAPTNKAANVLEAMLSVKCKTIHSLLGLRMSTDSEEQELVLPERMPELSFGCIIVVDEAGMVNEELCNFIEQARNHFGAKIMYVGDPAQLPPVGEVTSKCWKATTDKAFRAFLKKVMRFDNQLLKLATMLRECVKTGDRPVIKNDNKDGEGVFVLTEKDFLKKIVEGVESPDHFIDTKVLAWRNKTVNHYNNLIRDHLGFSENRFAVGDLLMVASPVELGGSVVATIDEDLVVKSVRETQIFVNGYDIPVYELVAQLSGGPVLRLNIPHEDDEVLPIMLSELADKARRANGPARKIKWREFWAVKNKFHNVRYGYAMTTHRVQGSTLKRVFIDTLDVLANRETDVALRCLYVASTRPTQSAYFLN